MTPGRDPDPAPDPAIARFAVLQALRLSGALLVLLGALALSRRFPSLDVIPEVAAYAIIAVGLADFFVVPMLLARRWRSPRR
ncbi:MAG: hypothetical protein KGL48_04480 [Sphingomonadales bacterium]|nr:hypothetical protein [Sphingomonadales bacterium]MDE2567484.1 hypothetical protein [Sphingomonadales bacterium]